MNPNDMAAGATPTETHPALGQQFSTSQSRPKLTPSERAMQIAAYHSAQDNAATMADYPQYDESIEKDRSR
jgi:hypothetical protein